jgi:hypothetical protein
MAKRKPEPVPPTPPRKPKRLGVPLHVWVDPRLMAALDAYAASLPVKPTMTAAVSMMLERFLRESGHWPPPAAKP